MARAAADRLVELHTARGSRDIVDADGPDDGTSASGRKIKTDVVPLKSDGRLQLRRAPTLPPKYKGHKVSREEAFGKNSKGKTSKKVEPSFDEDVEDEDDTGADEDEDGEDENGEDGEDIKDEDGANDEENLDDAASFEIGGLQLAEGLEEEYDRLMQQTRRQLEIRKASDPKKVDEQRTKAEHLKRQLAIWASLAELRIRMEGSLELANRLPVDSALSAFCKNNTELRKQADSAATAARRLVAEMLLLQRSLAKLVPALDDASPPAKRRKTAESEVDAWKAVDDPSASVRGWAIPIADAEKERTRLDVTKSSFKVLDQTLATQMMAVDGSDHEKLIAGSKPAVGKHQVFGLAFSNGISEGSYLAGPADEDAAAKEIYDDRDFYVSLLREVLSAGQSKNADGDQAALQDAEGKRHKQKKSGQDVERRASKGRKIRYVPIDKLQNFMASRPRPTNIVFEHDTGAMDALIRSLFGGGS